MTTRTQKVRLGGFVLGTAALLVAAVAVFGGMRFWERHDEYRVDFERSVIGLEEGAEVRYNGVRVGRVEAIELAASGAVRVELALERGTAVRADTRAILAMRGITGLKQIDLRGGDPGSPLLPPGSAILTGESTLERLERQLDGVMEDVEQVAENMARASAQLEAVVSENRAALREAIASIGGAARGVSRFLDRDARALVTDTRGLLGQLEGVVKGSRGQVRAAMLDIRRASASVKELARDLRARPSRLLFSQAPKDRKLP